ncbi:MAG: ROK family protein [Sphingomonas sp.]|nr:ROK family protein [Sphingomonas sp.]
MSGGFPSVGARSLYGAVEAGGTKINLAVGRTPTDFVATARIETRGPAETNTAIREFFEAYRRDLVSIGVASFGPVRVDRTASDWGKLLATPKAGWSGERFTQPLIDAFELPVGLEKDVTAAALAEQRFGALRGFSSGAYITVGTGVGAGILVAGAPVRGSLHPELGHIRVVRGAQDADFWGCCPYHGDCLEGLASGPAIARRWGASLSDLPHDHPAHGLIAGYLAQACMTLALVVSTGRIVIGGGVSNAPGLHSAIAAQMRHQLGDYLSGPVLSDPEYISKPALSDRAGLIGALQIAERAAIAAG